MLSKDSIQIHPSYQRDQIISKVQQLVTNFSWVSFGALIIGSRNGEYWVIDGQHRLLAAKRRPDVDVVPCVVFHTSGIIEEAKAFLNANTGRRPVTAIGKYKASIVCEDETTTHVHKTLAALGLTVKAAAVNPGEFKAISLAMRLAKENKERFDTVMMVATELCLDMVIQAMLLDGLFYLDKKIPGGILEKRFNDRLKTVGARKLLAAANKGAVFWNHRAGKEFAFGMLEEINKGLRIKFEIT